MREAEGREFDSEMAGLLENKKKLDREIRHMEALLDGAKSKVLIWHPFKKGQCQEI